MEKIKRKEKNEDWNGKNDIERRKWKKSRREFKEGLGMKGKIEVILDERNIVEE